MESLQTIGNVVDQATGEANTIFGGGNVWVNYSVPPSAVRRLGVSSGAAPTTTQQATTFSEGVNATNAGTKASSLYWVLMGGTTMLQNAGVGYNGVRGAAATAETPTAATTSIWAGRNNARIFDEIAEMAGGCRCGIHQMRYI